MSTNAKQYDESLVSYYDDELIGHADTVFRFAFALTLSVGSAHKLVKSTFQSAAAKLGNLAGAEGSAAVVWLLGECWRDLAQVKGTSGGDAASKLATVLRPLAVEARAAVAAVDVAGLSIEEATKALGWSEADLRSRLAAARKALVASGVEI